MTEPMKVKRCPAPLGAAECGSAVFYDWGLKILETSVISGPRGPIDRYRDYGSPTSVIICARCTTPYLMEGGDLVSIADELSAEDVKAIITRGQMMLPHPVIKDP